MALLPLNCPSSSVCTLLDNRLGLVYYTYARKGLVLLRVCANAEAAKFDLQMCASTDDGREEESERWICSVRDGRGGRIRDTGRREGGNVLCMACVSSVISDAFQWIRSSHPMF